MRSFRPCPYLRIGASDCCSQLWHKPYSDWKYAYDGPMVTSLTYPIAGNRSCGFAIFAGFLYHESSSSTGYLTVWGNRFVLAVPLCARGNCHYHLQIRRPCQ